MKASVISLIIILSLFSVYAAKSADEVEIPDGFEETDLNGDGMLSEEEFNSGWSEAEYFNSMVYNTYDHDDDGSWSRNEFKDFAKDFNGSSGYINKDLKRMKSSD